MKTILFLIFLFLIVALVSRDWKTIRRVMTGWGIVELFNFLYYFPFWIWMQYRFGILAGSIYTSIGATIINFGLVIWYEYMRKDWLGVNILEDIEKKGEQWSDKISDYHDKGLFLKIIFFFPVYLPAKIFKFVIWSLKKTELTTFFIFSIFTDSFKTTVFMRHGVFSKINYRDAKIFVASAIISCTAWSILNILLVRIIDFFLILWRTLA